MKHFGKFLILISLFFTLGVQAAEFTITVAQDPGTISMFGGDTPPHGWKVANGESLLRSQYPKLFQAIGVTYGSVDGDHFTLPDLRGIFPKGAGVNSIMPSRTGTLGEYQADTIQGHGHNISNPVSIQWSGLNDNSTGVRAVDRYGIISVIHATTLVDIGYGVPRVSEETKPANVSVTYMIKVDQ